MRRSSRTRHRRRGRRVHSATKTDPASSTDRRRPGAGRASSSPPRRAFVAHVPLPEKEQIEALVLEKKKKDLLAKYASEELQGQQGEAKAMLNKRAL